MPRFWRFLALVCLPFSSVLAQNGYTYTLKVTGGPIGNPPGVSGGPGTMSYVGQAQFVGSRGRVTITDGGLDPLFTKGDYLIVDSATITVVHPARQEYFIIGRQGEAVADRLASMGVSMTLSDERVKLDSLGPGDTISGIPTRRYRMSVGFNMSMDGGSMPQRLGTESVTDYWVGNVPGLPSNPLLRSNGLGSAGTTTAFKSLSSRVDSVSARMGSALALRTSSNTRVVLGPGQILESQQSAVVSDLERRTVDEKLLVVPATFHKIAPPM